MKPPIPCLLLFLAITLCLPSCTTVRHYLYAPVAPQVPALSQKGEINTTGMGTVGSSDGTPSYNNGWDVQAAYALGHHVAVTAAWTVRQEKDSFSNQEFFSGWRMPSLVTYQRHITQFGLGYFTPINGKRTEFFDLYGGYGFGTYSLQEQQFARSGTVAYSWYHNTSVSQVYLQPGVHINGSSATQVSLSMRFTGTSYHHILTSYLPEQQDSFHMASLHNTFYVFIEPVFTLRFGLPRAPWVMAQLQLSFSGKINNTPMDYRGLSASAGLSFDWSKLGAGHRRPGAGKH